MKFWGLTMWRNNKLFAEQELGGKPVDELIENGEKDINELLPSDTMELRSRSQGVMLCENELPVLSVSEFVGLARRMGFGRPYRPGDILKVIERQKKSIGEALSGRLIGVYSSESVNRITLLNPEKLAKVYGMGPVAVVESWNGNIGSLVSDGKQLEVLADTKGLLYPCLALHWAKTVGLDSLVTGRAKELEEFLVGLPEHPSRQKEFLMKLGYVSRISYLPTLEIENWMERFDKIDIVKGEAKQHAKVIPGKAAIAPKPPSAARSQALTKVHDVEAAVDIVALLRPNDSGLEKLEQRYQEISVAPVPTPPRKPALQVGLEALPEAAGNPVDVGEVINVTDREPESVMTWRELRRASASKATKANVMDDETFNALFPHKTTNENSGKKHGVSATEKKQVPLKRQRAKKQRQAAKAAKQAAGMQRQHKQTYPPKQRIARQPNIKFHKGTRFIASKFVVHWEEQSKDQAGDVTGFKSKSKTFSFGTVRAGYRSEEDANREAMRWLDKCAQDWMQM